MRGPHSLLRFANAQHRVDSRNVQKLYTACSPSDTREKAEKL